MRDRNVLARTVKNLFFVEVFPYVVEWVTWKVPKSVHRPLRFCVRAWDEADNESKSCAKIKLRLRI